MAFKKYVANKDTSITNVYKGQVVNVTGPRHTGSNTGLSDTLQVFSVYNRVSSSTNGASAELSRLLIEFPVSDIKSDRNAGTIPAKDSVSFILNLYDQQHGTIQPTGYDIEVLPLSASWEEGYGVDATAFSDVTNDRTGANWMRANGTDASGSATIKIVSADAAAQDSDQQITLVSTDGTSRTYIPKNGGSEANGATIGGDATQIRVNIAGLSTQGGFATRFKEAIEATAGHTSGKLTVTLSTVTNTNDTLTIKQTTTGYGGNTTIPAITNGNANLITVNGGITATAFTGGSGTWANVGGADIALSGGSVVTGLSQSITTGSQDLSIDVTSFVEEWISESNYKNYGFLVKITDAFEALNTTPTSVEPTNSVGVSASFYTKHFHSRTSDKVFSRPAIEAQWDNSKADNRANFYYSSSLAPAADNLNKLFLYNKIRGNFKDIPNLEGNTLSVSLYSVSGATPGDGRELTIVGGASSTVATAGKDSTGIYSCSLGLVSGAYETIYDVWFTGSTVLYRGTFTPKEFSADDYYGDRKYIFKIRNGKTFYNITDSQRLHLYTRAKNTTPNIFTVSQNTSQVTILPDIFYRVVRTYDDLVVVPFGTGSNKHTKLSYDASGSYFDFDFGNLQKDFEYKFEFTYYEDYASDYIMHPYSFKFRTIE